MIRKCITYLGKQELFLRQWLSTHSQPPSEPSRIPRYLGALFVIAGILWGARRAVRTNT